MSPILQLSNVTVVAGPARETLLHPLSLTIQPGERLGIAGRSGAGKSTLLRLLNRLQPLTGGEILYAGQRLEQYPLQPLRRQIMLVPQEPKLLEMTVRESLLYSLTLQKLPQYECRQRLLSACDFWQIPADWLDRNELQLSVGQRQRVTLARGAIAQPKVLLLDEPTSALDPASAQQVLANLHQLSEEQGVTVLMVNHTPEYLTQLCQRLIKLDGGRLVEDTGAC